MTRILLLLALLASMPLAAPASAQDAPPTDAYLDPGARVTLERALEARLREVTGIESYEARVWERVYVGLTGSSFRRERGLFSGERVARVRWDEGERVIRWEGAVQGVPVTGRRSDEDEDMANQLAEALANLTSTLSPMFYTPGYAPGDDRIMFGQEQWSLHPVSDTAHLHYRYRSGDTLRVTMPPDGRTITLVELQVEPRRGHPRFVAGSFWFDENTGQIVRAAYRPSTPYYLAADDGDPDAVRGLLRGLQAEIRQITVDYGLHHFEWWLPYRFALTLEVRAGGLLQLPVTVEWRMDDYRVNEPRSAELDAEVTPEGWTRREVMRPPRSDAADPADSTRLVTLVPPAESLHLSPELTRGPDGRLLGPDPIGFSERELEEFREELDRILPPTLTFFPRLAWGMEDGLVRYNRVEGLSVGVAGEMPLGRRLSGRAEARIGSAALTPLGELRLLRGGDGHRESVAVYRRLAHTSDWEDPLGLSASLTTLVRGRDRGEYYRTHGVELRVVRRELPGSPELRLFGEAHRSVERATDFHLTGLFGSDTLRTNRPAEEGTWYGGAVTLRGDRGTDPGALRLFGQTRIEAAWGDGDYRRLGLSAGAARRLGPIALALEGGVGSGWGDLPPQREFYLGGPATVRGVRPASVVGESYWFSRAELARGFPAVRVALFTDWAWAGPRANFGSGRPVQSVGAGISFLDGLVRFDLARALDPGRAWRMHFYLDGLL